MWRKKWEKASGREYEYKKYQKTAQPLVMGKFSLAIWLQLEE